MTDKTSETLELLQKGLENIFASDNYKQYLKVMGRFPHYSINNEILIFTQKPDATLVASFSRWKQLGRAVKKSETGLRIFAPVFRKAEETEEDKPEYDLAGFRTEYVFDVSQTYGKELPSIAPEELVGNVCMYEDLVKILKDISPVPVQFDEINTGAKGYYSNESKEIVVKEGMGELATVKTLLHEICHALLHDHDHLKSTGGKKSRQQMETEAESVAFVTASHLGLDTSDYSFNYIAGWSQGNDLQVLQESLADIHEASNDLISRIDQQLDRIDRYELYQIPEGSSLYDHKFSSYDGLEGIPVKASDYQRVYMGKLDETSSLDDIYTKFNLDHPEDFKGHSLSMSDVIVMRRNGEEKAFYVDTFGYKEIAAFKEVRSHEKTKQKTR